VVRLSEVQSILDLERLLAHYRVTSIDDINRSLEAEATRLGLSYTDKLRLICHGDRCAFLDGHRDPYFFDYGHWTLVGAKHFGQEMLRLNWFEFAAPHKPTG